MLHQAKNMKKAAWVLLLTTIVACNTITDNLVGHQLISEGDKLLIRYTGEGDVVQFKMFEGLSKTLKVNSSGVFKGQLEIPNLDDGIFSYDIIVHKKDSLGNMEVEYVKEPEENKRFLWIGKNSNISFSEATDLRGVVTNKEINSTFLEENRNLTIYDPKEFNGETPIIYMTDGSVIAHYAPYVDKLISEERIIPVKLVGVHSSKTNRYKEYVDNKFENDLFKKHEDFFYKEVLKDIESEQLNWKGKRYIYGFSNGAAFCMHAGINHPEIFEEIIAFSTVDYISEALKSISAEDLEKLKELEPQVIEEIIKHLSPIEFEFENYPKFYMGAGRYEESIFRDNIKFVTKMKDKKIHVEFKEFISGHDYNVWKFEFLKYLEKRFGK